MFGEKFKTKFALTDQGLINAKKGVFWTVVVNLLSMASISLLYLLMTQIMTLVSGAETELPIWFYIIGVVIFLLISFIAHKKQYYNTYGTVYGEVGKLRTSLAEHLRKLPLSFFGGRDLADLAETIMSDVAKLEHVWSHVVGYLYGAYISTAIVAVIVLIYNWKLALAAFWTVPVAFGLLFGMRKITIKGQQKQRADALIVSDGIQEMLEDAREIRATNQENRYLENLNKKIDKAEKSTVSNELLTGLVVNGASVIMRLGVATTILVGSYLILSGQIDFMVMFMFMLLITRIYAPFDQALALIAEMFMVEVSGKRLQEINNHPTSHGTDDFHPVGHDITFHNVSFAYGTERVLENVSFTAKEGEITALVGPSGSGKSTCARLAARLWDVNSGTITVGGIDISQVDPEVLMSDFSMIFQDVTLFDDTVMENIRLGKRNASDEQVLAAAKAANCDEFVTAMPNGYASIIGENGSKLSGGERQRISIARALLKDAPILLMDEATASLDVENESQVQEALSRLLEGKTVLVIAHRMRTVENADKIIVLKDGKICEEGTPAQLQAAQGTFNRMVNLQKESEKWEL